MTHYEDRVVTAFTYCSVFWALLGMTAGVYVAAELVWPTIDGGWPALSFGRLRTAHTTLVLFGFGVSALIGTAFYSVQRTSHVRLFAPRLAWAVFYAWQATIVLGAVSILAGWNAGKEYAELEWPFDLAITAAWVGFAVVFFGTIAKRKVEAIYISNWFYGALIIVVAMLHIVNSLALPVTIGKSYSLFAGAQDAVVQWWYGHNAVGFLLTGGFLGMLYYFLPKQAEQPIWSYRLSILAFWAFVYTYIWAGPHHLHYHAIPEWLQSLGMVMSLILLAPSWATLVNGIMTVSGAAKKLKTDPALKFIVLALAFYGLATFEGPMLAIKSVNVFSHFTEWTIGHVHSGALGWNALITFGTFYFMVPRMAGAPLYSARLANIHFWLALAGTMLYVLAMWGAGVSQGVLWLSLDELGEVRFSFNDVMAAMKPYYLLRFFAGLLFLAGAVLMAWNLAKTFAGRRTVTGRAACCRGGRSGCMSWLSLHHRLERNAGLLIFGILLVSAIGGMVQLLPIVTEDAHGHGPAGGSCRIARSSSRDATSTSASPAAPATRSRSGRCSLRSSDTARIHAPESSPTTGHSCGARSAPVPTCIASAADTAMPGIACTCSTRVGCAAIDHAGLSMAGKASGGPRSAASRRACARWRSSDIHIGRRDRRRAIAASKARPNWMR